MPGYIRIGGFRDALRWKFRAAKSTSPRLPRVRATPPLFGQGYAGVDRTKGEAQPLRLRDAILLTRNGRKKSLACFIAVWIYIFSH